MARRRLFSALKRWLIGVGALLMVLVVGVVTLRSELDGLERAFRIQALGAYIELSRKFTEGGTLMTALHGFYQSAGEVSTERFPIIAEQFLSRHPQVSWLGYAEYLSGESVDAFERRMERDGFMGFRVRDFHISAPASGREERLPIYLLEPLEPSIARYLGGDLLSHSGWEKGVQAAIESGDVRAIDTSSLSGEGRGFLLLRATYLGSVEPISAAERRRHLAGMLMVFLDFDTLMALPARQRSSLQLSLNEDRLTHRNGHEVTLDIQYDAAGGFWQPRFVTEDRLKLADLEIPVQIATVPTPKLTSVGLSMLLAGLFMSSLAYGFRLQRSSYLKEKLAFEQARLAEITLHSIGEAVLRLDRDGRVHYLNPTAARLSPRARGDVVGMPLESVLSLKNASGAALTGADLDLLSNTEGPFLLDTPEHDRLAVACSLSPVLDSAGANAGHVLAIRDVSREHQLSTELAFQARHDHLTGLPNRREFESHLIQAVESARRNARHHSLLYLDLDQFKLVNDTCGHAAGDEMLRQIAGLIAAELRERDVLARLGGDEFGVLLLDCPMDSALPVAQRICDVVAGFRFNWEAQAFELGTSIGLVEVNSKSGTADDVQRTADLACYAAKDMGRNRVHIYRLEDRAISRRQGDMQWHVEINKALAEDRFLLHAQPILALSPEAIPATMCELLVRLRGADGELVPPMAFIPAAERYGLMPEVDRTVICQAMQHLARSRDDEVVYTVNLSGQSMADPGLGDFILGELASREVDATRICFEVTETTAISNLGQAVKFMHRLRGEGFRFALDDFGAGLSSFSYLKQLPLDYLKIDGQFVRDIDSDPVAQAMVSSIITVAGVLQLQTVAEMVENERAQACLEGLGVDYIQGYHVGRPAPLFQAVPRPAMSA